MAVRTPEQAVEFLKSEEPLFEGFPKERLAELAAGSRVTTFEPN